MITILLSIFRNHAALVERVAHLETQLAVTRKNAGRAADEHRKQVATLEATIQSQAARSRQLHNAADNLATELEKAGQRAAGHREGVVAVSRARALAHWRSIR